MPHIDSRSKTAYCELMGLGTPRQAAPSEDELKNAICPRENRRFFVNEENKIRRQYRRDRRIAGARFRSGTSIRDFPAAACVWVTTSSRGRSREVAAPEFLTIA